MKFLIILLTLISISATAKTIKPKSVMDFKKTSVKILNMKMNSGGTGSIYKSNNRYSEILTNKHVCRLIEQGGYVQYFKKNYKITSYKKYPNHDLCMVKINKTLNVSLILESGIEKATKKTFISGHPLLLPHIVNSGHMSDLTVIQLMVGMRKCTDDNFKEDPLSCLFFGGHPIIQNFSSQVTSNLIQPGSSGSAVFNKHGKIVGVAFAGSGNIGYAHIVPHIEVAFFLTNLKRFDYVKAGTPVDDNGIEGRIFNFKKCSENPIGELAKKVCSSVKSNMIWVK